MDIFGFGEVEWTPVQEYYEYLDEVTLTATGLLGGSFVEWQGAATGTENPITITILGDTNISAYFTAPWLLEIVSVPYNGGSTNPSGNDYYFSNEEIEITVTANPGWEFDYYFYDNYWVGGFYGSENPFTVIMPDHDTSVLVYFSEVTYESYLPIILK